MSEKLEVGSKVPPFAIKDHKGFMVTDEDLLGSPTVIFFYPKDNTPGCTKECCTFQDHLQAFDKQQVIVIGVSPDSEESHQQFIQKYHLNFSLLCDEKKDLAHLFGVLDDKGKYTRSTFMIDGKGKVLWMEKPVALDGHMDRVIEAMKKLLPKPAFKGVSISRDYRAFFDEALKPKEIDEKLENEILKRLGLTDEDLGHDSHKK